MTLFWVAIAVIGSAGFTNSYPLMLIGLATLVFWMIADERGWFTNHND